MSYIRCLSNPEGLYIYGGANGLNIIQPDEKTIVCDEEDFLTFIKKWSKYYDDNFIYKNFRYEYKFKKDGEYKVYLTIDDHIIEMWDVTWMYIVNNVIPRK